MRHREGKEDTTLVGDDDEMEMETDRPRKKEKAAASLVESFSGVGIKVSFTGGVGE